METTKKFATLCVSLMMVFSLAACGGSEEEPATEEMMEEEVVVEDEAMDAEEEMSDEAILETVRELVDLLAQMETMGAEEAMGSMDQLFTLAAELQNVDGARVEALLENEPELKAAIEALEDMSQK